MLDLQFDREISVFSVGFGESIVVRVDDVHWIVIDSALDESNTSIPLNYLQALGVNVETDVIAIILTHWHDDHVAGGAELVAACPNAQVAIPGVLRSDEFKSFLAAHDRLQSSSFGSGVTELFNIRKIMASRGQANFWCLVNSVIYEDRGQIPVRIEALSPSHQDFENFLLDMRSLDVDLARVQRPDRNAASVACVVESGEEVWLFGADLEDRTVGGWNDLIGLAWRSRGAANFFKIAHHGSANGDRPEIWEKLLVKNPEAVLTPYNRGWKLPKQEDVERILSCTTNAHTAGRPVSFRAPKKMNTVEKELAAGGIEMWRKISNVGQVRFRKTGSEPWRVEYLGSNSGHLSTLLS